MRRGTWMCHLAFLTACHGGSRGPADTAADQEMRSPPPPSPADAEPSEDTHSLRDASLLSDASPLPDASHLPVPVFEEPDGLPDPVGLVEDCPGRSAALVALDARSQRNVEVTLAPSAGDTHPTGQGDFRFGAWLQVRSDAHEPATLDVVVVDEPGQSWRAAATVTTWYPNCAAARLGVGTSGPIPILPGETALLRVDNVYGGAVLDPITQVVDPRRKMTLTSSVASSVADPPQRPLWVSAHLDAERAHLRIRGQWSPGTMGAFVPPPGVWVPLYAPPFGGALALEPERRGDAGLLSLEVEDRTAGPVVTTTWALPAAAALALNAQASPTVLVAPDAFDPMGATLRALQAPRALDADEPCDPESVATACPPGLHCAPDEPLASEDFRCRPARACPPAHDLDGRPVPVAVFAPANEDDPTRLIATLAGPPARLHLHGCGAFEAEAEALRPARLDVPVDGMWRIAASAGVESLRVRRTCDAQICDRGNADMDGRPRGHVDLDLRAGESIWVFGRTLELALPEAPGTLTATLLPAPEAAIRAFSARFEPERTRLSISAQVDETTYVNDAARFELVDTAGSTIGLEHVVVGAPPYVSPAMFGERAEFAFIGFVPPMISAEMGTRWTAVRMRFRPAGPTADLVAEVPLTVGAAPSGEPFMGAPTFTAARFPDFGLIRLAARSETGPWGGELVVAPLSAAGQVTAAPVPLRLGAMGDCRVATSDVRFLPEDADAWREAVALRVVRGTGPFAARPDAVLDVPIVGPSPAREGDRCGLPHDGRCDDGLHCARAETTSSGACASDPGLAVQVAGVWGAPETGLTLAFAATADTVTEVEVTGLVQAPSGRLHCTAGGPNRVGPGVVEVLLPLTCRANSEPTPPGFDGRPGEMRFWWATPVGDIAMDVANAGDWTTLSPGQRCDGHPWAYCADGGLCWPAPGPERLTPCTDAPAFASVDAEIVTDPTYEPPALLVYGTLTRRGASPLDGILPAVGFRQTTPPQTAAGRCWLYDASQASVDFLSAGPGTWRYTLSAPLETDDQWCGADLCPICDLSLVVDDGHGRTVELPGPLPVRPARTLMAGEPCDPTRGHERDPCDPSLLCVEPMGESGARCVDPATVCRPIWPYPETAAP